MEFVVLYEKILLLGGTFVKSVSDCYFFVILNFVEYRMVLSVMDLVLNFLPVRVIRENKMISVALMDLNEQFVSEKFAVVIDIKKYLHI